MLSIFSEIDVLDLKENPSENAKLSIVNKLARNYGSDMLTDDEKEISNQVLKLLAKDISTRIRISISEKFANNSEIPYEVALQLANDMEQFVAVPVIQFSKLLTEDDLTDIILATNNEKQNAVARRTGLTDSLKDCIINYGEDITVATLANNQDASLSKTQCKKILEKHQNSAEVVKVMIENKKIDDDGTLEIIMNSSEELKSLIMLKYNITSKAVTNLVEESKENTVISMIRASIDSEEKQKLLADKLYKDGQTTFPLLIKSLGIGAKTFFYQALANSAQIPFENVKKVIEEGGEEGTRKLFLKAHIPDKMAAATFALVQILQKHSNGNSQDIETSVLKELNEQSNSNATSGLNHLLTILSY